MGEKRRGGEGKGEERKGREWRGGICCCPKHTQLLPPMIIANGLD